MALTKEQQYKLINRYQSGDKTALVELIKANSGLVWDYAYKYYNIHKSRLKTVAEEADFAQEGYIGLIEGVRRFDTTKNVEFSTYIKFWIEQRCRYFARACYSSVKISVRNYEKLMRKKMCESFGVDCIKSPTLDKIDMMTSVSSLNVIIGDSYDEMIDLLVDNNNTFNISIKPKTQSINVCKHQNTIIYSIYSINISLKENSILLNLEQTGTNVWEILLLFRKLVTI